MGEVLAGHGGDLALAALARFGVKELFTLNGAHVWPFYDAAVKKGWRILDTRHEQTATFAAEAYAKLTRRPGIAVLTAGPGVTNGLSAVSGAWSNGSPLLVLGGRAQQATWGAGALQEFDHLPLLSSITKDARTVFDLQDVPRAMADALSLASAPHRGPVFLDVPLDVLFSLGEAEIPERPVPEVIEADPDELRRAAELLAGAERPAIVVGTDVYWAGAWTPLREMVEALRLPTFVNGLGRGCLPADHELAFSRTRGLLKARADVVAVIGTPLDFRLSFGRFGDARVVHLVDHPDGRATHVTPTCAPIGDLGRSMSTIAAWEGPRADHEPWIAELRAAEAAGKEGERALLAAGSTPIKPTRVYGELRKALDRDAIVVCDGGDFVSYAGKYIDSYEPGCWLDPGPYGCLGTAMGYALAARVVHPDRQVVVLLGDGAAGFSLMDVDSLVRHGLPVVIVCGNNGIWGLEKHPMRMIYGYDVACDLQPATRYDEVVRALGGAGETVEDPDDLGAALRRGFAADAPYLINVLTDPEDAYPRSSMLL
ncbi:MAG: acetolactate synthase [Acidimicrobiales bacterium]|jgi:acetolactate synthase-1/2/3 large subunit|nr:acetolactate synthase [Acidimicrobiales bacterium]